MWWFVAYVLSSLIAAPSVAGGCVGLQANPVQRSSDSYLAFRITPGIGKSAYETYIGGHNDDDDLFVFKNVPYGCKTRRCDNCVICDRHYRSRLLDLWVQLPIETVTVSVYKDCVERVKLVFDGRDSTYTNWFSQEKLLASTYTDLDISVPTNNFSIEGCWVALGCGRSNISVTCDYEKRRPTFPQILFSNQSNATVWNTTENVEFGDSLEVVVRLASQCCSGQCCNQ